MQSDVFELISLGFRYWFVLLGLMIVWRALRWQMADQRAYQKIMKALPDAGLIGELVDLSSGESWPLPREGVIGSSKGCDIRFSGVRGREFEYAFVDGKGVEIIPAHRSHQLVLDGEKIGAKAFAAHGSRLNLPGYSLRFRLFSGLNVPFKSREAAYQPEEGFASRAFSEDTDLQELYGSGMPLPDQLPGLQNGWMPSAHPGSTNQSPQDIPEAHPPMYAEDQRPWDPEMTWRFAVPPPETYTEHSFHQPVQPVWEQEMSHQSQEHQRKRRSRRHGH